MVNTFLPYPDLQESVACLDYKRLGKQRVETKQILKALRGETAGWRHHPAVLMWRGHDGFLVRYGVAACCRWSELGYRDTLLPYFLALTTDYDKAEEPWWFGFPEFHDSHKSNLVRKEPEHYRKFFPDIPDDLPYYWPTHFPFA